jgi:hypothetical protein
MTDFYQPNDTGGFSNNPPANNGPTFADIVRLLANGFAFPVGTLATPFMDRRASRQERPTTDPNQVVQRLRAYINGYLPAGSGWQPPAWAAPNNYVQTDQGLQTTDPLLQSFRPYARVGAEAASFIPSSLPQNSPDAASPMGRLLQWYAGLGTQNR